MKLFKFARQEGGTPVDLQSIQKIWIYFIGLGGAFWILGLGLWAQEGIDQAVLFYFNPQRIVYGPVIQASKWLSSNGMAAITIILVTYLLLSRIFPGLDAPLTVYFYTICSYGLSSIAGDLLKLLIARPRPRAVFGTQIVAISDSLTQAIPSGHATKSVALVLPFLLLAGSKKPIHNLIKVVIGLTALGVCFSRVALGAHYLSDVLAGIGMALFGLPFTMAFANLVLRNVTQEQLPAISLVWGFLLVFLTAVFLLL